MTTTPATPRAQAPTISDQTVSRIQIPTPQYHSATTRVLRHEPFQRVSASNFIRYGTSQFLTRHLILEFNQNSQDPWTRPRLHNTLHPKTLEDAPSHPQPRGPPYTSRCYRFDKTRAKFGPIRPIFPRNASRHPKTIAISTLSRFGPKTIRSTCLSTSPRRRREIQSA